MIYLYLYIAGMIWFSLCTLLAGTLAGSRANLFWVLLMSFVWPIFMTAFAIVAMRDGINERRKELARKGVWL